MLPNGAIRNRNATPRSPNPDCCSVNAFQSKQEEMILVKVSRSGDSHASPDRKNVVNCRLEQHAVQS
jgi:hypothetical protein